MMRFFAFLLAFVSLSAFADTVPSVQFSEARKAIGWGPGVQNIVWGTTHSSACQTYIAKQKEWGQLDANATYKESSVLPNGAAACSATYYWSDNTPRGVYNWAIEPVLGCQRGAFNSSSSMCEGAKCPDTTYMLSSDQTTCTRSDTCPMFGGFDKPMDTQPMAKPDTCTCPAGTKWYAMNGCRKTCAYADGEKVNAGWDAIYDPKQNRPCYQGCVSYQAQGVYYTLKNGMRMGAMESTGWACAQGDNQPPDDPKKGPTPDKIKDPVCAPTDGVMTSSSGAVKCVPEGTPDTGKPIVKKETKNETFPDGSTKITETTKTKDPNTGAEDTQTKTTTGPASSGGAGQAGPVGTGTSSGNTSGNNTPGSGTGGNGTGGNCEGENCGDDACDPTLNFCGGPKTDGAYTKKDKTAEGPLQAFASGVRSSLLGSNASGFFTVTIPSGGCPSWSVEVPYLKTHIDVSQYICSAPLVAAMDVIGAVLVVLAAFAAFRWAML